MADTDIMMNVSLGGHHATLPARIVASDPLFVDQFNAVAFALLLGAFMGLALGILAGWLIQRTMSSQGEDSLGPRLPPSAL